MKKIIRILGLTILMVTVVSNLTVTSSENNSDINLAALFQMDFANAESGDAADDCAKYQRNCDNDDDWGDFWDDVFNSDYQEEYQQCMNSQTNTGGGSVSGSTGPTGTSGSASGNGSSTTDYNDENQLVCSGGNNEYCAP
ncbi:hypothetical protein [Algibacter pacificus]|uniref:hypothetical protein n=1 Tax=Algibacter pacificus TaxID=2599389 RepID=UPI0011C886AE|nr:hypothetical protein [Algibacter pacificus]